MKKSGGPRPTPVGALTDFSAALIELAEQAPERTTAAQMAFFVLAGMADAAGKPATFTEIRDAVGPTINRSLHTTYKVFLDRVQRRSDTPATRQGLGWLTREEDPEDNRRKYLRLTPKGRAVIRSLVETLQGGGKQ
jgi:hypothetical protein